MRYRNLSNTASGFALADLLALAVSAHGRTGRKFNEAVDATGKRVDQAATQATDNAAPPRRLQKESADNTSSV